MHRQNDLHPCLFEGSRHTGVVRACCEAFGQTRTHKTVVVRDHASLHRREAFADRIPSWKQQGWISTYLPPASPAFNLIAILWRRIKDPW
jgi:transposase